MPDLETDRLVLHPVDVAEARRIRARTPGPEDRWADDYPFDGDVAALTGFLAASDRDGDQRPFGYYRIDRRDDGRAIGGIGFKGRPVDSAVEIGYGLVPSGRGHGFAADAARVLMTVAADNGVHLVLADTGAGNTASIRTLERAGFACVGEDAGLVHFRFVVGVA